MTEIDMLYVLARRVLLDALEALGAHRNAIILVGAQAVYLHVGESDIAIAPFTTDGDLVLDPSVLSSIPPLEWALMEAGFLPRAKDSVGIWIKTRTVAEGRSAEIAIDLLVPEYVSPGGGRRAARLPGHDPAAARIVKGLEGALVDADLLSLASLEANDGRSFEVRVAGPAALLVAKVHKIADRQGTGRQSDKDALDVFRILRGVRTAELAERYRKLLSAPKSAAAAKAGLDLFKNQFARRNGVGVGMTVRATEQLIDANEVAASFEALAGDLLNALGARNDVFSV